MDKSVIRPMKLNKQFIAQNSEKMMWGAVIIHDATINDSYSEHPDMLLLLHLFPHYTNET